MALHVAAGQFSQRRVTVERPAGRGALVQQHVAELLAQPRPAGDQPLQFGPHDDVGQPLPVAIRPAGGGDARAGQRVAQLVARQRPAALQSAADDIGAAAQRRLVQFQPAIHPAVSLVDARPGQLQQPADVGRGDEVPRRPQDVGAQDVAGGEGALHGGVIQSARPQPQCRLGPGVLLRLDSHQPGHDLGRRRERRRRQALVGQPGVGKMSIIEGIAERMVEERVPTRLQDKRLVQLSTAALLAGTTTSGAEERLLHMMAEIRKAGNVILFINNIHDLVSIAGGGGKEGLDVASALAEYTSGGSVVFFATTTPEDYNKYILNSELGSVLIRVDVNEMNDDQTIQVLESRIGTIEYKQQVFFSYDSLASAADLAHRYLHDRYLPESAIEIITEAASVARSKRGANQLVLPNDVASIVSGKTGIPTSSISEEESDKLLRLESVMHERVVGQDEAVSLVANALRRARAEIRSTSRPIANFLFLGPTGVGKTELAKTIAEVYFGGENRMVRLDMSEYQDKASVYRLIGQPGRQGTGILTEAVRQRPFSLVLLDELEKADPDVLNLFLQVFDDGRLTDSVGRVIDFTNTIIIATSNAGTQFIQASLASGMPLESVHDQLLKGELSKYYRPEFLNRFDGVVLFRPLEKDQIKHIAKLMLNVVAKDLEKRGVELRVEDSALEALAVIGFDPVFGARPMRRAIQDRVENALAQFILEGKLERRDIVILDGEGLRVEKAK